MKQEEFCNGVKILLERMKTNPEDFDVLGPGARFGGFAHTMSNALINPKELDCLQDWQCLRKEEQQALIQGYKDMGRERFSKGIMEQVLKEPDDSGIGVYAPEKKKPKKFALNPAQYEMMMRLSDEEKALYIRELEKWSKEF